MLTEPQLRHIIAQGERFDVEFKADPLDDGALVENAVCLANGRGGLLLVGVEDDGTITGAAPRHGTITDPRRVEALVANRTVPSIPATCQLLKLDGHDVLAVEVPAMIQPVSTQAGVFKRRAVGGDGKPACVPFHFHEMQAAQAGRGAQDYSALVLPDARWEDLDPLEFERLRQTIQRNPARADRALLALPNGELVRALGLGDGGDAESAERLTVAAILMLGREAAIRRLIPTHEAAFQVLTGTRITANDFFRGPLIAIAEELGRRFDARNESEEIALGPVRVGIPDYSGDGFREAVHNALVHRDYTALGAVHVQWHADRIEVSNPGGFVEGVGLGNLLVTAPRPRNPVLADAFKRIGLVERTGRGIDTIYEGQLRYGRPAPDYTRSTGQTVHVVLRGGPANLALARWIIEHETPEQPVTIEEMIVLNALDQTRQVTAEEVARLIQQSEDQARAVLERLVERGVLEARGARQRGRAYEFSAATYRALGDPAAYTRRRDFEPIQQEQMVLQHVEAHGRITRQEVADLCQLSSDDARNVIRRLVRRGDLQKRGTSRRDAYYVRSPSG